MYEKEKKDIAQLSAKIGDIEAKAAKENRPMNAREAGLVAELGVQIDNIRMELPVDGPRTLQNFGGGSPSAITAGRFAVDVDGKRFPMLARGERLTALSPRPQGEEGAFTIENYLRQQLGVGEFKAAVGSGTATVPTYVGAEIIDDVRALSVVVEAGASTINITGPTNLAKVTADPTIYQHTEATADVSESAPTIVPVSLNPKTLAAAVPIPLEVFDDAPPGHLDNILRTSIAGALALKLDTLCLATLIADANVPKSGVAHDPVAWAGVMLAVTAALAANQRLPEALIGNTADFMARASQLASTAGSWLGKPPALANMRELYTTGISAGTAILGNFARGFAIAVRQDLRIEVIRFQKPLSVSHVLMVTARMDGVVLQPKQLFKELKTP